MIGTILLTKNNQYVKDNGELPKRPDFDKGLLTNLCKGSYVSHDGYNMLPPSIQKVVIQKTDIDSKRFVPITIKELSNLGYLLIVVRSNEVFKGGKVFRFKEFKCLHKTDNIEIWRRK